MKDYDVGRPQSGMSVIIEDPSYLEIEMLRRLNLHRPGKEHQFPASNAGVGASHGILGRLHPEVEERGEWLLRKLELLEQLTQRGCRLCGHQCGGVRACISRMPEQQGVVRHFTHLGEEPEIGDTQVLEMLGCSLKCRFCHRGESVLDLGRVVRPLNESVYRATMEYKTDGIGALSFLGGDPALSMRSILKFLRECLDGRGFPRIVFHSNLFWNRRVFEILQGIVDIFVLDYKFFNNDCAARLTSSRFYQDVARAALCAAVETSNSETVLIVRHLVLPGHFKCCTEPLIKHLAENYKDRILFHPMTYYPAYRIQSADSPLDQMTSEKEIDNATSFARGLGLEMTKGVFQE